MMLRGSLKHLSMITMSHIAASVTSTMTVGPAPAVLGNVLIQTMLTECRLRLTATMPARGMLVQVSSMVIMMTANGTLVQL